MIAELFVGMGDIITNYTLNHNFKNWAERWNTAHEYDKKLKNLVLKCTKTSECYSDIGETCMECINKLHSHDIIIYGNAHIITNPSKWIHILTPFKKKVEHNYCDTSLYVKQYIVR